jgi:hypothetical protein
MVGSNFGFSGNATFLISGLTFKGSWDALINSPFLQSGVGTAGDYYIVTVAGSTNLDGITDWQVGDWAIFESATNMWQKIDNHDIVSYNTIQNQGVSLPPRSVLDFQGAGVTASDGLTETVVTIPIQPAYATIEDEGIALPQRQIIDFQGLGVQATDSGGKTVVTVLQGLPATNYGLYTQTANSTIITNTASEVSLIGTGVGTLSVPANSFFVGASFRADFGGVITTANNQTLRIRVKTATGVVFLDSGVQNLANLSTTIWTLTVNFTIRQIGGVTIASIVSLGKFTYAKTSNAVVEGFNFNTVNATTFDSTILNTLEVTAQFGSANPSNTMYSDIFVLNKIY